MSLVASASSAIQEFNSSLIPTSLISTISPDDQSSEITKIQVGSKNENESTFLRKNKNKSSNLDNIKEIVPGADNTNEKLFMLKSEKEYLIPADEKDKLTESNKAPPSIAWLASYPNSGTSYTLHLITTVSNRATATNYGSEAKEHLQFKSIPIHPYYSKNGPYRTSDRVRQVPEKFVLTKTHCGGRCVRCPPSKYIETVQSFSEQCLSAQPLLDSDVPSGVRGEIGQYDSKDVKKAVHIMRDPFDNIVSRFHHAHKNHRDDPTFKVNFPKNSTGFKAWCLDMNKKYNRLEEMSWDSNILKASKSSSNQLMVDVPCRNEFYRYIQWHEMTLKTVHTFSIPTLFFQYEDYIGEKSFNETLGTILSFLELSEEKRENAPEFHASDYSDHFTHKERLAAMNMMKIQASHATWERLERYRQVWNILDIDLDNLSIE